MLPKSVDTSASFESGTAILPHSRSERLHRTRLTRSRSIPVVLHARLGYQDSHGLGHTCCPSPFARSTSLSTHLNGVDARPMVARRWKTSLSPLIILIVVATTTPRQGREKSRTDKHRCRKRKRLLSPIERLRRWHAPLKRDAVAPARALPEKSYGRLHPAGSQGHSSQRVSCTRQPRFHIPARLLPAGDSPPVSPSTDTTRPACWARRCGEPGRPLPPTWRAIR